MRTVTLIAAATSALVVTAHARAADPPNPQFAVFYENDPRLDDPCKFLFVNIAGTVLPGGSNNYLQYPIGPFATLATAQLARDTVLIEAPPAVSNLTYSSRCRHVWSVDTDPSNGTFYMRNELELGSRFGMKVVASGLCGRDAAALVRGANGPNGLEPAYAFDVCVAPAAPGGLLQFAAGEWRTADGKKAALPPLPGANAGAGGWVKVGVSDCTGQDTGRSDGSAVPVAGRCDAASAGTVAVCWDGARFANPPGGASPAWCTYKRAAVATCKGGGAPGFIYECRAR